MNSTHPLSDANDSLRSYCHGLPPLRASLAAWMIEWIASGKLHAAIDQYGSPLNLISLSPMDHNIRSLSDAARAHGCHLGIFFARKANKCLSFVRAAEASGIGVDTASTNELQQTLNTGIAAERVICTAAIKSATLIAACVDAGVVIAVDNHDELELVTACARQRDRTAKIAIRLGGFHHQGQKLWTRFGFDVDRDADLVARLIGQPLDVQGVHFHLDGYDAGQRVSAISVAIGWIERLRAQGFPARFIDMGGGFPVSYLETSTDWEAFWRQHAQSLRQQQPEITYQNHPLGRSICDGRVRGQPNSYPFWQEPVAQQWLSNLLGAACGETDVAEALNRRQIELRCEPGRSLLQGCGMTVARVEFRKQNAAGDWLIGISMNRTQCRTTSDDFLVDPILIPAPQVPPARVSAADVVSGDVVSGDFPSGTGTEEPDAEAISGYLVGAYCTEAELILLRRLRFPRGVRRGDLIVFPNTAGYWMHFMESRSHQFPLASNLVVGPNLAELQLDEIDRL